MPGAEGSREPAPELLAELAAASASLETADPPEIIRWAAERFGQRLTMATAFGPEGCVIIHWLATVAPNTHVFNLETGYQFKETLDLRDRLAKRYGIEVALEAPDTTVQQYERLHGGPLYRTDSNRCCHDRKIDHQQAATGTKASRSRSIPRRTAVGRVAPLHRLPS